jgi:TonB family protein
MKFFYTLAFVFTATLCFAQRQNIYFLKNNGQYVDVRDSADYIRILREPDTGSALFNVFEYYLNGKIKFTGKSLTISPIRLQGTSVGYYKSGGKEKISNYKNGRLIDEQYIFYPNGKMYLLKQYPPAPDLKEYGEQGFLVKECTDSLGTSITKDGNGRFVGYDDTFTKITEEGRIKNGKRDSIWAGNDKETRFKEIYKEGELISGVATYANGTTSTYSKSRLVLPEFAGGVDGFGRFIGKNVRYPQQARERGIQGVVIVSFVIEKDGSLSDIKAAKPANPYLDNEAIKMIGQSPKWLPGTKFGVPIRTTYSTPISFTLGQ